MTGLLLSTTVIEDENPLYQTLIVILFLFVLTPPITASLK